MKVGLVLGAGGIQGGAWLTGALDALAERTGWDPAEAEYVVGTSAGSMIGALCASGVPPWFMVAHSRGEVFEGVVDADGRPAAEADRAGGARFRLERALPPIGPGSWRLALRTLANPRRFTPATVFSGWIPRGIFSTASLRDTIRRVVPSGWSPHPNLWVVACDYETGRRVPFGRAGAPEADLADAVAASCAIPGLYHPQTIAGRRYVDGGIYSTSNADLLRDEDLDLVICLNPTSTLHPIRALNPREWLNLAMRNASGRRLGSEAKKLGAARHRGHSDPADQRRPRGDGSQPDEPPAAKPGDRRRPPHRRPSSSTSRANRELLADLPAGRPAQAPPPRRPALGVAGPRRAPAGRRPARMNESRRHRVVVIGGGSAASTQAEARAR